MSDLLSRLESDLRQVEEMGETSRFTEEEYRTIYEAWQEDLRKREEPGFRVRVGDLDLTEKAKKRKQLDATRAKLVDMKRFIAGEARVRKRRAGEEVEPGEVEQTLMDSDEHRKYEDQQLQEILREAKEPEFYNPSTHEGLRARQQKQQPRHAEASWFVDEEADKPLRKTFKKELKDLLKKSKGEYREFLVKTYTPSQWNNMKNMPHDKLKGKVKRDAVFPGRLPDLSNVRDNKKGRKTLLNFAKYGLAVYPPPLPRKNVVIINKEGTDITKKVKYKGPASRGEFDPKKGHQMIIDEGFSAEERMKEHFATDDRPDPLLIEAYGAEGAAAVHQDQVLRMLALTN